MIKINAIGRRSFKAKMHQIRLRLRLRPRHLRNHTSERSTDVRGFTTETRYVRATWTREEKKKQGLL